MAEEIKPFLGIPEIDKFLTDLLDFAGDHWVALGLLLFIAAYILIVKKFSRIDPRIKTVKHEWKSLQKRAQKITDKLFLHIGIIGGGYRYVKGSLYLLDTVYEETKIKTTAVPRLERTLEKQTSELGALEQTIEKFQAQQTMLIDSHTKEVSNKNENDWDDLTTNIATITNEIKELEAEIQYNEDLLKYAKERKDRIYRKKSETYAMLCPNRKGGEIIAIRKRELSEQETLCSQAEPKKLAELDLSKTFLNLYYLIFFMGIYILVVMILMITETDPEFLFQFENFQALILVILVPIVQHIINLSADAYKLQCRAMITAVESFRLTNPKGDILTLNLPVFDLDIHWNENMNIENTVENFDTEQLASALNTTTQNRVTYLSTENANLQAETRFLTKVLNEKDKKINQLEKKAEDRYYDGLYDNATSKPLILTDQDQGLLHTRTPINPTAAKAGALIGIVLIIVVGLILVVNLLISNFSTNTSFTFDFTAFGIWALLIIVAAVLLLAFMSRIFTR